MAADAQGGLTVKALIHRRRRLQSPEEQGQWTEQFFLFAGEQQQANSHAWTANQQGADLYILV